MQKNIVNVLPRLLLALLLTAGAGSAARAQQILSQDPPHTGYYSGEIQAIDGITVTINGHDFKATTDVIVVTVGGAESNNLLPLHVGDTVSVIFYDEGSAVPDASRFEILPEATPLP